MDFSQVKSITVPEGEVTKIESGGVTLWEKQSPYAVEATIKYTNARHRETYIGFAQTVSRGIEVDWGDGAKTTYAGTFNEYPLDCYWVQEVHTYQTDGQYTIKFKVLDGEMIVGIPGSEALFLHQQITTFVGDFLISSVSINNGVSFIIAHSLNYNNQCTLTIDSDDLIYIESPGRTSQYETTPVGVLSNKIRLPKRLSDYASETGYKTVHPRFLKNCDNFTGELIVECDTNAFDISNDLLSTANQSAPEYQTGITLSGPYASALKTALPDRSTSPYRKLILSS